MSAILLKKETVCYPYLPKIWISASAYLRIHIHAPLFTKMPIWHLPSLQPQLCHSDSGAVGTEWQSSGRLTWWIHCATAAHWLTVIMHQMNTPGIDSEVYLMHCRRQMLSVRLNCAHCQLLLEFCRKFCLIDDGSDVRRIVRIWCLSFIKRFQEFLAYFLYVCCFLLNFIFIFHATNIAPSTAKCQIDTQFLVMHICAYALTVVVIYD